MITFLLEHPWLLVLSIITAILGVGRLTRVIVYDDFPPSVWWRIKWAEFTHDGPWNKLFTCWWCLSFWVMLVTIGLFSLTFVAVWIAWVWWVFYGALAMSYLSAIIISRDTPE